MKFDEKYPDLSGGDKVGNCIICKSETVWYNADFLCFICSEECVRVFDTRLSEWLGGEEGCLEQSQSQTRTEKPSTKESAEEEAALQRGRELISRTQLKTTSIPMKGYALEE